jgi:hypothetical protein
MDEQSDYHILSADSAITLAEYPFLWSDPELGGKEDSRSDEDSELKADPCEAAQQGSQDHSGLETPIVNSTQRPLNSRKNDFRCEGNDGLMSGLPTRAVLCEVSKLLRVSPPCGVDEQSEIGSRLRNQDGICSLVSVLQLLYHIADIRSGLLKIDDGTDPAFAARQVLVGMGLRRLQGAEQLRQMQAVFENRSK